MLYYNEYSRRLRAVSSNCFPFFVTYEAILSIIICKSLGGTSIPTVTFCGTAFGLPDSNLVVFVA